MAKLHRRAFKQGAPCAKFVRRRALFGGALSAFAGPAAPACHAHLCRRPADERGAVPYQRPGISCGTEGRLFRGGLESHWRMGPTGRCQFFFFPANYGGSMLRTTLVLA